MGHYRVIGDRLKLLRGGLTQQEFAKKLDFSVRAYQYYEAGDRVPKGKDLSRIAAVCGVPEDYILTGDSILNRIPKDPGFGADRAAEVHAPYGLDDTTSKILQMLMDMDQEARRDVLKYAEKEKLLADLKRERKKEAG
jgi:transcriptional regulator with XRE-family HTH domain